MNPDTLLAKQDRLHQSAKKMLDETKVIALLSKLGNPILTGSYTTELMAYPDIDISVQNKDPDLQKAIKLFPELFKQLNAKEVKITDFTKSPDDISFYIGIDFPYEDHLWRIDATVTKPGPIRSNPPEIDDWIQGMTHENKLAILHLKNKLIQTKRYLGARSQPPFTFRSVHVYEGVIKGSAKSVKDLEDYFAYK